MDQARALTLSWLIAKAVEKHKFLEPPPPLTTGADVLAGWLRRLVAHVEQRDWAEAFEIIVGKPQAEWSPADVQAFYDRRQRAGRAKREFAPGETFAVLGIEDHGTYACTRESLLALATSGLSWFVDERKRAPTKELPIIASVLLLNGHTLNMACDSENRIAVLKHLARTEPAGVYGFWIVFDAFLHAIDIGPEAKATKRDCVLCQLGTRDTRRMLRRTYEVLHGVAVFDPPLEDLTDDAIRSGEDPYAEVFVSVPPPTGRAS